jgi:hypothetical protein
MCVDRVRDVARTDGDDAHRPRTRKATTIRANGANARTRLGVDGGVDGSRLGVDDHRLGGRRMSSEPWRRAVHNTMSALQARDFGDIAYMGFDKL